MARPPMSKDRSKCGIPMRRPGEKTTVFIKGAAVQKTFKSERVIKDDDGNIIGVETQWQ